MTKNLSRVHLLTLALFGVLLSGCGGDLSQGDQTAADRSTPEFKSGAVLVSSLSELAPGAPLLRVTMVDVGQGDGLLVQFPGGANLAVDGGPSMKPFKSYLQAQGVTGLDYAVLTHAHVDHYAGLTPVLDLLPGDCQSRVFDPGYDRTSVGYQNFLTAAGCRYQPVGIGETLALDPQVEVMVISAYSVRPTADDSDGINNTSVVLRLRYGRFAILLEGDAEVTAEKAAWKGLLQDLPATVLKAGHHGSCTASGTSYLHAVAPQYVMISAGAGNSYGLPHCQTMDKLKAMQAGGLRWVRTDSNGTVSVVTDGSKYAVVRSKGDESDASCPRACAAPSDF